MATAKSQGLVGRKPEAKSRGDEQEGHIRPSIRGERAQRREALWFGMQGRWHVHAREVGALIRGGLRGLHPAWAGSVTGGNAGDDHAGVSRRHSSRRKRAGSSRRRVTRPTNELEVSYATKARTEMISTSPFARVARPHRPVHRVRGAKRTAQPEVNDPLSGYIVFLYPTTVR